MSTALLALIAAQQSVIVGYLAWDHLKAEKSRRTNRDFYRRSLGLSDAQLDAALATYARAAGKKRRDELQESGRERDFVLAGERTENQQSSAHGGDGPVQESFHRSIVQSGADV